jgi:hypothetical protein
MDREVSLHHITGHRLSEGGRRFVHAASAGDTARSNRIIEIPPAGRTADDI